MKLVKLILGGFVLAGTFALPMQVAAETTNVEETTTNEAATTTNNETTPNAPAVADKTIAQNFPDPVVAAKVATALSTTVDAVVTDADLAGITDLRFVKGTANLAGVEKLTGLRTLSLDFTSVTDISVISNLTVLEYLSFYANDGIANYDAVENLTTLKELAISSNTITKLPALDNLSVLDYLGVTTPLVTDYSIISTATTLTYLSVRSNGENLKNIDFIKPLTELAVLSLANNAIEDITPLAGLTKIELLSLSGNKVKSIAPIAALENLKFFAAADNRIEDVSPLSGLANLTEVYMPFNMVEDISPLANVKTLNLTYQIVFYEGKLPGSDIYVANEVRGLDGNLVTPALISDNGRYENGNLYFSGMTNASRPAYTFNVGDAPEIPLPDLSQVELADETLLTESYEQNFMSSLDFEPTANETVAFSGVIAYFFTTEGTDIATKDETTEGILPNTGENTIEKSVLGGSAVILGAIALVLRRKF